MFTGVKHLFNIYPSLFTPLYSRTLILLHCTCSGTLAMRLSAISFGVPIRALIVVQPWWIKLPTVWRACHIYHQVCKSIVFYHLCVWERSKSRHKRETHPVRSSGIYSASLDCGKDLGHQTPAETLRSGTGIKYLFTLSASPSLSSFSPSCNSFNFYIYCQLFVSRVDFYWNILVYFVIIVIFCKLLWKHLTSWPVNKDKRANSWTNPTHFVLYKQERGNWKGL